MMRNLSYSSQFRGRRHELLEDRRLLCGSVTEDISHEITADSCILELGMTVQSTFEGHRDTDVMAIDVPPGEWYEVRFRGGLPLVLGNIRVVDESGTWGGIPAGGRWLVRPADEPRRLYVIVTEDGSQRSLPASYTVTYTQIIDDFPDVPAVDALPIVGEEIEGWLQYPGDVDYVAFEASAGKTYSLRWGPNNSRISGRFESFSGEMLTSSWRAQETGVYFARMSMAASNLEHYWVKIVEEDTEGYSASSAMTISSNIVVDATLDWGGDVDWFRLDVEPEQAYSISLAGREGILNVYDSDGVTLIATVDTPARPFLYSFTTDSAGPRFLEFYSPKTLAVGDYRLLVSKTPIHAIQVGFMEGDDALALGVPDSVVPTTVSGRATASTPTTSFRFRAVEGRHDYLIDLSLRTLPTATFSLYDPDGNLLASEETTRDARISWPADRSGIMRVDVTGGEFTGSFDLSAAVLAWDASEENDQVDVIVPDQAYSSALPPGGVDRVAMDLVGGDFYLISLDFPSSEVQLRITDEDDRPVAIADSFPFSVEISQRIFLEFSSPSNDPWTSYAYRVIRIGDDHGNSAATATTSLDEQQPVEGRIGVSTDDDVFYFDAIEGINYEFSLEGGDQRLSLSEVRDGVERDLIAFNDPTLRWSPDESGRYYLRVSSSEGTYLVSMKTFEDDHANRIGPNATLLAQGNRISASFDAYGDRDVFSVSAEASQWIHIDSSANLRFYNESGDLLEEVRSSLKVPESGTYYVEAFRRANDSYFLEFRGVTEDPHPDSPDAVTEVLPPVGVISGYINASNDVDVFAIDVQRADDVVTDIEFRPSNGSTGLNVELQNESGDRFSSRVSDLSEGRYYIVVRGNPGVSYDIRYSHRPDIPGDVGPWTPKLTPGEPFTSILRDEQDVDVFAFDAAQGETIEFRAPLAPAVRLWDPDANLVGTIDAEFKRVWIAQKSGTYTVDVANRGDRERAYELTVIRDPLSTYVSANDDHPDVPNDRAVVLQHDVFERGKIDEPGDLDVFAFDLAEDQYVSVWLLNTNGVERFNPRFLVFEGNARIEQPTQFGWRPGAPGRHHLAIAGNSGMEYSFRAQIVDEDHGERLDETATLFEFGTRASFRIAYSGDRDVFRFPVKTGDDYEVVYGGFDSYQFSLGSSTNPELFHGELGATGPWTATFDGFAYLTLTSTPKSFGSFFTVNRIPGDDHSDDFEAATPVQFDAPMPGQLGSLDDVDIFAITGDDDVSYEVITAGIGVDIKIYDRRLRPISEEPAWKATGSGLYYVAVSGAQVGDYDITVRSIDDDHANFPGPEATMMSSSRARGDFEIANDIDVFRLDLQAGDIVTFEFYGVPLDVEWQMLDSTEQLVDRVMHLGRWKAPETGIYYLSGKSSDRRIGYEIRTTFAQDDFFDSLDLSETAPAVALGNSLRPSFETPLDIDVFPFDVVAGDRIEIVTSAVTRQDPPLDIAISDPAKQLLLEQPGSVKFIAPTTGRYFAQVPFGGRVGEYSFRLSTVLDDHPDTIFQAVEKSIVLAPGNPKSGVIELPGDVDTFFVDALAGDEFELVLTGIPAGLIVELFDGQGERLAGPSDRVTWQATRSERVFAQASSTGDTGVYSLRLDQVSDASRFDLATDGILDTRDLDALTRAIHEEEADLRFDLDQDKTVKRADLELLLARMDTTFGDLNLDGRVDFADFLGLSATFGSAGSWSDGDLDGNAVVDFADFLLLAHGFGTE